jgi:hypothetical protein
MKYHHLRHLDFWSYAYLHIIMSPAIFMDTDGIIDTPDPSGCHISTFYQDLPYDNAAMPVK